MPNEDLSKDTRQIYAALSHPIRKTIVDLMAKNERIGFRDLKEELNVSVGTLYYHLDTLGDLITQDKKRKYILTDKGKLAIKIFTSSKETLEDMGIKEKTPHVTLFNRITSIVLPKQLFAFISSTPRKRIVEATAIIALGSWLLAEARLEPILLFFNSRPTVEPYMIAIKFFASWLLIFALSDGLSYLIYRRKEEHLTLLSGTAFSLSPIIFYAFLWALVKAISPGFLLNDIFWWGLMLICQIWSIGLLSIAISISKALRIDRAAVISFLIQYLNIIYVLFFVFRFTI
ncbi:helix-turn-helix transcriptional regulator [Candidatus Bathyarchaeota archaeon]|nr:helix-turn-helix transcriptional regulator [Candidatus Bathyarchaeota archaeon]